MNKSISTLLAEAAAACEDMEGAGPSDIFTFDIERDIEEIYHGNQVAGFNEYQKMYRVKFIDDDGFMWTIEKVEP